MTTITNAVLKSVSSQQRHTALVDCTVGWDGEVDAGTILQGVHDRLKAVNLHHFAEGGLVFRRTSLTEVALVAKTKFEVELDIVSVLANGETYVFKKDVFHEHEVDAIVDFMKEHVYH